MMILNQPDRQTLGSIADRLAGSDPKLASMLNIFSRLAAGEAMPVHETIRVRWGRPTAHRPRRTRRPRRSIALRQERQPYPRLGRQQAVLLLLWAVISAAVLAVVLLLNPGSHKACVQPMGTACPAAPSHSGPGSAFG